MLRCEDCHANAKRLLSINAKRQCNLHVVPVVPWHWVTRIVVPALEIVFEYFGMMSPSSNGSLESSDLQCDASDPKRSALSKHHYETPEPCRDPEVLDMALFPYMKFASIEHIKHVMAD